MDYSDVYTGADFTFNAIDPARPFHDTLKYAKQGTQMPQFPGIKTTVQTLNVVNIDNPTCFSNQVKVEIKYSSINH